MRTVQKHQATAPATTDSVPEPREAARGGPADPGVLSGVADEPAQADDSPEDRWETDGGHLAR